jgi:thiol-disulfide isomerase/thioredoxin
MKNLMKNFAVFVFLTFAVSGFVACTNSASTQSGKSASSDFPPAPSAVMQAEIKDIDGNAFKLEDKKGKIVLINLWATWCGPCRAEMPELVALQDKYRDKNFEILGLDVQTDETPEEIKDFAKKMKLNYQLGYAEASLMNDLLKISKTGGIPQSFLIDGDGRLRGAFFGVNAKVMSDLKETVAKVVGE